MAANLNLKLSGDKELNAKLDALKQGVRGRMTRKVFTKAARPVAKAIKQKIGRRSGKLRKAIAARTRTKDGVTSTLIAARKSAKETVTVTRRFRPAGAKRQVRFSSVRKVQPSKYVHLVELPTRRHQLGTGSRLARKLKAIARGGKVSEQKQSGAVHPGTPGAGVIGATWEAQRTQVLSDIEEGLRQEILKLAS